MQISESQAVPVATELPSLAVIRGTPVTELPEDLYIPPDALEVILETFEGPLDLLLYLIKRQNLDILDIPVASITAQYVKYIEMMQVMKIEIAAEYLVMAAMLAEIKSRLLLPRPASSEEDEADPRAELVRRLQEYERYRNAAEQIEQLPRSGRDTFETGVSVDRIEIPRKEPEVEMSALLGAFRDVLRRSEQLAHHHIHREPLSVRERMSAILEKLGENQALPFESLFTISEGRHGVVVSFLAILELCKEGLIQIAQAEPLARLQVSTPQGV